MNKTIKGRFRYSPAYIDSGFIAVLLFGALLFSTWIAYATQHVINPFWLAGSMMTIVVYELCIYWLLRQYWEADKIFFIFTTNIVCLGLIFSLVEFVTNIQLPVQLPILNVTLYAFGIQAESVSPGAVGSSYALLALLAGFILAVLYDLIDDRRLVMRCKQALGLDKIDFVIDKVLDKYSFWMDGQKYPWIVTPLILLVVTCGIVIGSAAFI